MTNLEQEVLRTIEFYETKVERFEKAIKRDQDYIVEQLKREDQENVDNNYLQELRDRIETYRVEIDVMERITQDFRFTLSRCA